MVRRLIGKDRSSMLRSTRSQEGRFASGAGTHIKPALAPADRRRKGKRQCCQLAALILNAAQPLSDRWQCLGGNAFNMYGIR